MSEQPKDIPQEPARAEGDNLQLQLIIDDLRKAALSGNTQKVLDLLFNNPNLELYVNSINVLIQIISDNSPEITSEKRSELLTTLYMLLQAALNVGYPYVEGHQKTFKDSLETLINRSDVDLDNVYQLIKIMTASIDVAQVHPLSYVLSFLDENPSDVCLENVYKLTMVAIKDNQNNPDALIDICDAALTYFTNTKKPMTINDIQETKEILTLFIPKTTEPYMEILYKYIIPTLFMPLFKSDFQLLLETLVNKQQMSELKLAMYLIFHYTIPVVLEKTGLDKLKIISVQLNRFTPNFLLRKYLNIIKSVQISNSDEKYSSFVYLYIIYLPNVLEAYDLSIQEQKTTTGIFTKWRNNRRLLSEFNELVNDLIQAAIRRGELLEVFFGFTLPKIIGLKNVDLGMISNCINTALENDYTKVQPMLIYITPALYSRGYSLN